MKIVDQQVSLVDFMGTDLSVVNAARVSFDKVSDWEDGVLPSRDRKLIKYLAEHNHWSPFSHASASFRIKAPIFVARQLVKHQVGFSWNEVSRRYVDSEPEFYIPEVWRARADNVKQGSSDEAAPRQFVYETSAVTVSAMALAYYKDFLEQGICPEQARMILPQNMMTEWIWSGSLYGWARMCKLRLDAHTQAETREIAKMIDAEMQLLFPVSWDVLMGVK